MRSKAEVYKAMEQTKAKWKVEDDEIKKSGKWKEHLEKLAKWKKEEEEEFAQYEEGRD